VRGSNVRRRLGHALAAIKSGDRRADPECMGVRAAFATRRLAKRLAFAGELAHTVIVPPGPDGRPGEELRTPSRPAFPPTVALDGSRNDLHVVLSMRGSALLVVCLGPSEGMTPHEHALETMENIERIGAGVRLGRPRETVLAGDPAAGYGLKLANGNLLNEWKLVHRGWMYAIGVLQNLRDGSAPMGLARESLLTWRWIDPPVRPELVPPASG
jgi:hypothetical protein